MVDIPLVMGYNGRRTLSGRGKASYLIRCDCGEMFDLYCWSTRKRCPRCRALYVYTTSGNITKDGVNVEWN